MCKWHRDETYCSLQIENMKWELLVIMDQYVVVNMYSSPIDTTHKTLGIVFVWLNPHHPCVEGNMKPKQLCVSIDIVVLA